MSQIKVSKPSIKPSVEYNQLKIDRLEDEERYEGFLCQNQTIKKQYAKHTRIVGAVFRGTVFDKWDVESMDFIDVRFEECDLSSCRFIASRFERVEMINCRISGAVFSDTQFQDCRITKTKADYAVFGFAVLKNCFFKETSFDEGNFQNAVFKRVGFEKCTMCGAQLSGAKLSGLDMREVDLRGAGVRIEDLKNVKVTSFQAVELSRLLGVIVED